MRDIEELPTLKQIVGSLLFAAKKPVTLKEIRKTLAEAAKRCGGSCEPYASLRDAEIRAAVVELKDELESGGFGLQIAEVAYGYRLQNDGVCGPWVRTLLDKDQGPRLSRPALETLAIVAYRQPCLRSEIESVRGVGVEHVLRNLIELQLVKMVGRSKLPGRPWLFGTTRHFLEHFGLNRLEDLPAIGELLQPEAADGKKDPQTKIFPTMQQELEAQAAKKETTESDDESGQA